MDDKENVTREADEQSCKCGEAGKSQSMKDDETNTDDIIGASNYERAEADQSKGIFAEQTSAYNKAMDEIIDNDDENAKDNLSDYMDELKEESENVGRPSPLTEKEWEADQQKKEDR